MSDLIEKLTKEFHNFNFFRAVYLVEQYIKNKNKVSDPIDGGYIRFRPDKSIAFPPNDIAEISRNDDVFSFTLYFMGLVGTVSPLPVYFSEYIVRHSENADALYDFITIFNHRIYALFYRAWKKYNFIFNFNSDGTDVFAQKVSYLCGFTDDNQKEKVRLLAYCGILSAFSRSASGLRAIISNYFEGIPVKIIQFMPRWAKLKNIKPLGSAALGKESFLGTSYFDRSGKFRIVIGPLSRITYEKFLPNTENIKNLKKIVEIYLSEPFFYDIEVQLQSMELIPVILGADETRLGETSALGKTTGRTDVQSIIIT